MLAYVTTGIVLKGRSYLIKTHRYDFFRETLVRYKKKGKKERKKRKASELP